MKWSYGVTAVPERADDLLPKTLDSLAAGGFDRPRLFLDGACLRDAAELGDRFRLDVVNRCPRVRAVANWLLALGELYLREPLADRYAVFQDDLVCLRNLRGYLERAPYPDAGYLNLYTFPSNHTLAGGRRGFYPSNQLGRGALGLVFSRKAVEVLLTHPHMVRKPQCPLRGWVSIDGGVVESFKQAGWREFVHNPSLVQHRGMKSTIPKNVKYVKGSDVEVRGKDHVWSRRTLADSFPGEDFDALTLPV
jgi:hypothetical protein